MNNTRPFVVFKHENEDFVLQNEQIVLNRYHREYYGKTIVEFQTKSSHKFVQQFFYFLQTGKVPTVLEDQIEVFELLKEWDCHDLVFDSFRFRIQSRTNDYYISHQNVLYPVNIGCFYFHSSAFQDFCHSNPNAIFYIELKCSAKTIEVFLDLLHYRIRQPELGDVDEVLELSRFLGCSSLCALINERSAESILSLILRKQEEESFDFAFFEHVIVENLESYLLLADFGHVCLTILSRVFQKTDTVFPISLLRPFFKSCVAFHGSIASVFLSKIKFQPANSFEELNQFLNVFSEKGTYDFFSLNSNHLKEFSKQFEDLKQDNQVMKALIDDIKKENYDLHQNMKRTEAEDQQIIQKLHQHMKSKEAEDQQKIEGLMKRLTELEKYQEEMDRKKKEEEEKRLREEQERRKREEDERQKREEEQRTRDEQERKKREEEERKQKEEYERIEKWKSTKAPDFTDDIFEAAKDGKLTNVIYLLANGTQIQAKDSSNDDWHYIGFSPLHYASQKGHLNVVEYLVNQKADIDSKDNGIEFLYSMILLFT